MHNSTPKNITFLNIIIISSPLLACFVKFLEVWQDICKFMSITSPRNNEDYQDDVNVKKHSVHKILKC